MRRTHFGKHTQQRAANQISVFVTDNHVRAVFDVRVKAIKQPAQRINVIVRERGIPPNVARGKSCRIEQPLRLQFAGDAL